MRCASVAAGGGSRFDAVLKADRLDLDAAAAFARSLAGPAADWPEQATVSLDIGRAISAGQELRPFAAKFGYTPKTISLDRLNFGQAGGVTMDGSGSFDRADATGKLTLNAGAASLAQITALVAPLAPALASRLDAIGTPPGPARLKLALDTTKNTEAADRANARAVLDLNAPQLKGVITLTAKPQVSAIRAGDLEGLGRSEVSIESKLSAERGDSLLVLLGLDHAVSAGDGAVQFEGSVSGVFRAPLRLNARMWGGSLDAEVQGTAEPWAQSPKASVNLRVRSVNLAPMFGLKPSDRAAQNVRVFAHVSLAGNKLTFDDLDSVAGGSRLRGHLALTLDQPREVDGEIGLDALDLAPAFALAIGAAGHDTAEPLGAGLMKGWRGRVAFQALSGALPGGGELRPVGGTLKSDGQSLTIDAIKGKIGGGDVTANIDTRQEASGVALNARLELANVDGAALHYRGLKMPAGRTSLQMTLASQGRSVSALTGALSGQRNRDAGGSQHCRPRSARFRRCDPRQRQWTGNRRCEAAADRRAGARPRAPCRSLRRKSRSPSGTGGCASTRPRSMPTVPAPSYRADTTFPPTRRISVPVSPRPRSDRIAAARKSSCSRRARPIRSEATSTSRRCRRGWR